MKTATKTLATIALCFSLSSTAFAGGIPVIDASSLAQQIEQVVAWGKQYEQMMQQIQNLQQQITNTTGSRGFSSVLNSPAFQQARRMLPQDAQTLLDLAANGSYGNLTNSINTIKQSTTTLNNGSFSSVHASDQWAADLNRAASNKALSMEAYNSAQQRLTNLENLMSQISTTQDPKAISELQARIATEQGLIQNEQAKIQAMTMLVAAEKQIAEMQARETSIKMGGSVASIPRTQVQP